VLGFFNPYESLQLFLVPVIKDWTNTGQPPRFSHVTLMPA